MRWPWFGRRRRRAPATVPPPSGRPPAGPVGDRSRDVHADLRPVTAGLEHSCPGEPLPEPEVLHGVLVHRPGYPVRSWPEGTVEEQRGLAASACEAACMTEEQSGSYYFEHYSLFDDSPVRVDQHGRAWFLASGMSWGTGCRLWVHSDDGTTLIRI